VGLFRGKSVNQKIKLYAFLSLLCLAPRLGCLFFHFRPENLISFYWELSNGLLHNGMLSINGIKTTAFEPLYPLFLAGTRWITGDHKFLVLIFQIVIGMIGCLYLYELGGLLARNKRVGLVASLLYSFYPYFIYQAGMIMEITLFATLLIISAYYYCKASNLKNSICCGIFFGLTILIRATALPILLLGIGALVIRKSYREAFLVLSTSILMLLPMAIRNYQIDGSFLLTRSGENLFDGNLEYSDKLIPAYNVDLLRPYVYGILEKERPDLIKGDRKKKDQFFTQKALQFMIDHPWRTFRLKLKNIAYLFHPRLVPFYPMIEDSKLILEEAEGWRVENVGKRSFMKEFVHSFSYTFILLTALVGIYLRRKEARTDLILYLIALSFIVVYSLYFPTTRLRAPMDFVLIFYSAYAIESFLKRLKISAWTQLNQNPT